MTSLHDPATATQIAAIKALRAEAERRVARLRGAAVGRENVRETATLLESAYRVRACFICGSSKHCRHREPEVEKACLAVGNLWEAGQAMHVKMEIEGKQ